MNRTLAGLALLIGSFSLNAQEQQPRRVEVKEPTVVNVHGAADRAEPACVRPKRGRLKLGGLKAIAGAGNTAGWLLNANDDIPSSRERARRAHTYDTAGSPKDRSLQSDQFGR